MNETTSPDPGLAAAAVEADRRLIRPTEGRVVAGVAAGLARYFGISPVVYRVAFAALVLLGGSGLILYAAAWLVIPDERRDASVIEEAIRERRRRPVLALGVVLVGLGLIFGIAGNRFWANPGHGWLPVLAIGLAIVWWQLQEKERPPAAETTPSRNAEARSTAQEPARPRRRRFPIFLPVMGVVIAGAGVLGVLEATDAADVNWTVALAAGVVFVGVAVAIGAFFGGVGALAAVGAVLAALLVVVATIDVPLHGPIGDRTVHPVSVQALDQTYRQAIGNLQLDLSDVDLPAGRTKVTASVGIGKLTVRVPDSVIVVATASVTAGDAWLLGTNSDGWNVDRTVNHIGTSTTPDAPTLVLDTTVGLGKIEVIGG
jgi:phage shock protein PspC (stress-responsive transcriptional regulator)/predicted membrane protein